MSAALRLSVALLAVGCEQQASKLDPLPPVGSPPLTALAIAIDGRLTEPVWTLTARRGTLETAGHEASPYSEIRLLRDATTLFVGLDAIDHELVRADAFELELGPVALTVRPTGEPVVPTLRIAAGVDGTIDVPGDEDAGWRVELAVPIAALGPSPVVVRVRRCDAPEGTRCGQWTGTLEPRLPAP